VPMWADVYQQLSERNAVGTSIGLVCPRHPETPILCSEPDDFAIKSPEGGCSLICDKRLEPCGHRCPAPCHSQRLHDAFDCLQPCPRIRSTCQHPCPKLCGQACGPCIVKVDGVKLPCGHVHDKVECHKTLDLESIRCSRQIVKNVPGCGHTVTVPCYQDVTSTSFRCPTRCTELLKCGHQCPGTCGRCRKQDDGGAVSFQHQQCDTPCGRPYGTCNHRCSKICHEGQGCGTCSKKCEVSRRVLHGMMLRRFFFFLSPCWLLSSFTETVAPSDPLPSYLRRSPVLRWLTRNPRFGALIPDATKHARSPALPALNHARGLANTRGHAPYPAPRHATVSHAMNVVQGC
jgi:hypothetical protein